MKRWSLRRRYWTAAIGTIVLIVVAVGGALLQERRSSVLDAERRIAAIEEAARRAVELRLQATAEMLSDSLINPVYFYDLEVIEQLLASARNQPDIGYAMVLDRRGRVLHDGTPEIARFSELPGDEFASRAFTTPLPLLQRSERWLEASHPLMLGDEQIGLLRIGLDLDLVSNPSAGMPVPRLWDPGWLVPLGLLALALALLARWISRRFVHQLAAWLQHPRRRADVYDAGEAPRGWAELADSLERSDREAAAIEIELQRQITRDGLTGLPNRLALRHQIVERLQLCRDRGLEFALMFIDLDEFKRINDTLGHDVGDDVLAETGKRFSDVLSRDSNAAGNFIARFGGDEFVVLVACVDARRRAGTVAEHLLAALQAPFRLLNQSLHLSASIGITSYPDDALDAAQLLKNGDIAMYLAKVHGRNCYRYFTNYLTKLADDRLALEQDLREAIANGELQVYYQPIVELDQERVRGAEALLRWHHPVRGMVPTSLFIGIAEDVGLIDTLGEFVLREASREAVGWVTPDGHLPFVAVNVSVKQFRDARFPTKVAAALRDSGLAANRLHMEMTESALLDNEPLAFPGLEELDRQGVHVWLDDFGTGFSGLSHLRRVPASGVKIDRSFTADLLSDRHDLALTSAIIAMARSLEITVVAEGVEKSSQVEILRSLRCPYGQGYWFGHPMPANEFRARLTREPAELLRPRISDAS
jgi:diguanylate cyclase (GGDEF)-like protein